MKKLDKAIQLYERGFDSKTISKLTGYRYATIRKVMTKQGRPWDKRAVVKTQVAWIQARYDQATIERAYLQMMQTTGDAVNRQRLARRKQLVMLGCHFGNYRLVLRQLLGDQRWRELQAQVQIDI